MAVTHTNLVHRADVKAAAFATCLWQWEAARARGLRSTTLVTYPVLHDAGLCAELQARAEASGDELGLHFHEMKGTRFFETYATRESAVWLLPRAKRGAVIDEMMALFEKRFGRKPAAVGSYIFDAWTLRYFAAHHPTVQTAITNCFEEGVNMFRGNNHNWHLFSDGGPWGPFWPSQANALVPARDAAEAIDIVALPHLNRDMILAVSSRDDLFASHPLNLFRAKINERGKCPYLFRFFAQWQAQVAHNGWSYLNIFVSSPWLTAGHWALGQRPEDGRALYEETLDYLRDEQAAGRMAVETMSEFGAAFRAQVRPGEAQVCHWTEALRPTPKRQMVWLVNSHYRAALDFNLGGALVDLRAYDGRCDGDMGPETKCLWNGNYPYLASAEHRGGFWNNGLVCELRHGTSTVVLHDRRVRATVTRREAGEGWEIETEPVEWTLGELRVTVVSRWTADASGEIRIERCVTACSDPAAELSVSERFGGCFGTTEYPEDLRGVGLSMNDAAGVEVARIDYAYASNEARRADVREVRAEVPQAGVRLGLRAAGAAHGTITEGFLFSPHYRLAITQPLTLEKPSITWLTLAPLQKI